MSPKGASILLRGTAGVRLLDDEDQSYFLSTVKDITRNWSSPPPSVEVLDGQTEAKLSWITANYNFLQSRHSNPDKPSAMIELGGGSLQVAFSRPTPIEGVQLVDVGGESLFAWSWLYLGLNAFRVKALKSMADQNTFPCFPAVTQKEKVFIEFNGEGAEGILVPDSFEDIHKKYLECRNLISETITKLCKAPKLQQVRIPKDMWITGFGYLMNVADTNGMNGPHHASKAVVTPSQYATQAFTSLGGGTMLGEPKDHGVWQPFDLLYIATLLVDFLGVEEGFSILVGWKFTVKLEGNDYDVPGSWSLGAAWDHVKA